MTAGVDPTFPASEGTPLLVSDTDIARNVDVAQGNGKRVSRCTRRLAALFVIVVVAASVVVIVAILGSFGCGILLRRRCRQSSPSARPRIAMDDDGGVGADNDEDDDGSGDDIDYFEFPASAGDGGTPFAFGAGTSSYQVEGAYDGGGRGWTVWDSFVRENGTVLDGSTGDVACDHYHRYSDDVKLMRDVLHLKAYRFSAAWSRILPNGTLADGGINQAGVDFYSDLIDALLEHDIEPWITMYHWDLPQTLEDEHGGWLSPKTVDAFEEYAGVLFENFGDRIHHWITVNEPWTVAVNGYASGVHAPGRRSVDAPYVVGHHLLLAHARAVRLYRNRYATSQGGVIGPANCADYRYPRDASSESDRMAADRAMMFQWGWFVEPLVWGDYPEAMRDRLRDRLPSFTEEERHLVQDSYDFLGVNYYSSLLASEPTVEPAFGGYWGSDISVNFTSDTAWRKNEMGWNVIPDGLRRMLVWVSERYGNPVLYVTENGSAEIDEVPEGGGVVEDGKRTDYLRRHLVACARAIQERGVDLRGYFAWSVMDNFEWQFGYQRRFGLLRVDFDSLGRAPKRSGLFYGETIESNGRNLALKRQHKKRSAHHQDKRASPSGSASKLVEMASEDTRRSLLERTLSSDQRSQEKSRPWTFMGSILGVDAVQAGASRSSVRPVRQLPSRLLIGYGSDCTKVRRAVEDGVNVVIWSFLDIVARRHQLDVPATIASGTNEVVSDERRRRDEEQHGESSSNIEAEIVTTLDLKSILNLIRELDEAGYDDTVHLASFGGWNGPHLDRRLPSSAWYAAFKDEVGDLFDGVDWDLEGHDRLDSPTNYFTMECLDKMGALSKMLKEGKMALIV